MAKKLNQLNNFIVWDGGDDKDRMHVEVKGLGMITINRTHEGLIVDIHSMSGSESIGTIALENGDFLDEYAEEIKGLIEKYDPNASVTVEFMLQAKEKELTVCDAVQLWFSNGYFDISTLKGLKGKKADFHAEIGKVNRPYIKISSGAHQVLSDGGYDYYLTTSGQVVTFGIAGEGSVLMPLNKDEAKKILRKNKLS